MIRSLRITGWRRWAVEFIAFNLIALVLLRLVVMTPIGHAIAVWQIERMSVRGQSIELSDVRGDLLGRFEVGELSVSDANGTWLEARNLAVSWSPQHLLNRTLIIRQLAVAEVDALKEPELSASGGSSRSRARPWRFDLGRGGIDRLQIEEGIFGRSQSLKLGVGLQTRGGSGTAQIRLEPLEERTDSLDLSVNWAPGTYPIGRLEIDAKAGGLIATLLRTPDGRDLKGRFDARLLNGDWIFAGQLASDDWQLLQLETSATPEAVSGKLVLAADGFAYLSPVSQLVGNSISLSLSAVHNDESVPVAFVLDADESRFEGDLIWQRMANGLSISDINARLEPGAMFDRLGLSIAQLGSISVQGDLRQTSDGLSYSGQIGTRDASVSERLIEQLVIDLTADYVSGALEVELNSNASGVEAISGGSVFASLNGRYETKAGLASLREVSVQSNGVSATGSGSIDRAGSMDLKGNMTLEDVGSIRASNLSWALKRDSSGELRSTVQGPFALGGLNESARVVLGENGHVRAEIVGAVGVPLRLESLNLLAGVLNVDASGDLTGDEAGLKGRIGGEPFSVFDVNASSSAGRFEVSFPNGTFSARGELQLPQLGWQKQQLNQTNISFSAIQSDGLAFEANFESTLNQSDLSLGLVGTATDQAIDLRAINIEFEEFLTSGAAEIRPNAFELSSGFLDFGGDLPGGGALVGRIQLLDGDYEIESSLSEFSRAGIALKKADLLGRGDFNQIAADVEIDGDLVSDAGSATLTGNSAATVRFDDQSLALNLNFLIDEHEVRTASPIQVVLGSEPQLSGELAVFGGRVIASASLGDSPYFTAALANVGVAPIGGLIGRTQLDGLLNGQFDLRRGEAGLAGTGELSASGLALGGNDLSSMTASVTADLKDKDVEASLAIGDSANGVDFLGTLEFALIETTTGWVSGIDPAVPVSASLSGSGDISQLWRTFGPAGLNFEGTVDLDLRGEGLIDALHLTGPVRLEDGVFEQAASGLGLKSIQLDAEANSNLISVRSVSANGWNGGSLTGDGHFGYDRTLELRLELQELDALNRDDLSAKVSGLVSIARSDAQTKIGGQLELNEGRLDLSKLPRAGYQTLAVSFEEPGSGQVAEPDPEGVQVNIGVTADRRLFVISPQLESEWGLDLDVRGTTDDLQLVGRANLVRGSVELLTNTFRLTDGELRFGGAIEESEIDLRANQSRDTFETEIRLIGDLLSPAIELSSSPALPEEEILSRVLFGQSAGNLSAFQAAQLASAAAALASGGSGLDIMGSFRDATGLDRVSIGENVDGSASLTTGKYLADNVYLEVETGASGTPALELEWTPVDSLQIDTQLDPELGPRLSIQWRRDFDRLALAGEPASDPESAP